MLDFCFSLLNKPSPEHYSKVLIEKLSSQEQVTVKDIFVFEFDRAYVFNDCYISGEGFAKLYNLKISIEQVKAGTQEYLGRIVFVDKSGNFVFENKYDKAKLIAIQEGIIIFPNTIVKKNDERAELPYSGDSAFQFEFESSELVHE